MAANLFLLISGDPKRSFGPRHVAWNDISDRRSRFVSHEMVFPTVGAVSCRTKWHSRPSKPFRVAWNDISDRRSRFVSHETTFPTVEAVSCRMMRNA